jgi:NAD(P)-dependent dehydrogenase (short-subunit alcohol dehydrogenase family)
MTRDQVHPVGDASLSGRRVLITGAAAGIGAVTAALVVARGGRVAILDPDRARGVETARNLGAENAIFAAGDVTDETAVEAALDAMAQA